MKLRKGRITLLLSKIGTDAEAAAEVLSIVANYLEHREQIPEPLADFIAQSFRSAASKYRDERLEELGFALGITVRGAPRKHVDVNAVVRMLDDADGISETQLKKKVADQFGVSDTTALRHIKAAKKARDNTNELLSKTGKLVVRVIREDS